RVEQFHGARVDVQTVEMRVVGILLRIFAHGSDEDRARLFIDPLNTGGNKLTGVDLTLDFAGRRVDQVIVSPAVTLRPVNQFLAPGKYAQWLRFDVGVRPLGYDHS